MTRLPKDWLAAIRRFLRRAGDAPPGSVAAVLVAIGGAAMGAAVIVWLMDTSAVLPRDHPVIAAGHRLTPVDFVDIPDWSDDDPGAALEAFRHSCGRIRHEGLSEICGALPAAGADGAEAKAFFERHFAAWRVDLADGEPLLTAYYEPVVAGSRFPSDDFPVPLYAPPADLEPVTDANRSHAFPADLTMARRTDDGLQPYPTRGEIVAGALDGIASPVAFVADEVEAFFIHIQGSTRIALDDGTTMRVGFAGRNGHPYTSVGAVMMERDLRPEGGFSMDGMRAFFHADMDRARTLMNENRSYIFFREIDGLAEDLGPIGAQSVPLTTQRSIAVDPAFHALGTPVFVDAELPVGPARAREPFRRLMIAQDTGSAIKGAARGDLFWGTGEEAGSMAGGIKETGTFYVLLPR